MVKGIICGKMNFFSTSELQKYEDIIDQIKTEFDTYEQLQKELQRENDNIIISRLANSKLTQKISHVNVKIFSDPLELFNLYQEELQSDFSELTKSIRCKYYLIEVYVSTTLMQKIKDSNWLLHISVTSENVCVNKTLQLTRRFPVLDVIPVDENIINCIVEAKLVLPSSDKWMVIKLDTVHIDISYHFQRSKEQRRFPKPTTNHILYITKCYNHELDIEMLRKPVLLEYKLCCDIDRNCFIQAILKNSYHKLDIEVFSQLERDSDFNFQFSSGLEKHKVIYNEKEKRFIIQTNVSDLCLLKKYFCKEFNGPKSIERTSITNIKPKENNPEDALEVRIFYKELRKSWLELPV